LLPSYGQIQLLKFSQGPNRVQGQRATSWATTASNEEEKNWSPLSLGPFQNTDCYGCVLGLNTPLSMHIKPSFNTALIITTYI